MSDLINLSNLNYSQTNIGRKIKQSKVYHCWEFCINNSYHKLELFHSKISNKVKLLIDNKLLAEDETDEFKFGFRFKELHFLINQTKSYKFVLTINDRSFDALKFETQNKNQRRSQSREPFSNNKLNHNIRDNDDFYKGGNLDFGNSNYNNYNSNFRRNRMENGILLDLTGNNLPSQDVYNRNKNIFNNIDFFKSDQQQIIDAVGKGFNNNNNNNFPK